VEEAEEEDEELEASEDGGGTSSFDDEAAEDGATDGSEKVALANTLGAFKKPAAAPYVRPSRAYVTTPLHGTRKVKLVWWSGRTGRAKQTCSLSFV
jgi:hypothetical protein